MIRRIRLRRGTSLLLLVLLAVGCRAGTAPAPEKPALSRSGYARETAYATGDPALDALQDLVRPTLEANRKEFAGKRGMVRGFGAGDIYPQVWLRDSATLVPAPVAVNAAVTANNPSKSRPIAARRSRWRPGSPAVHCDA